MIYLSYVWRIISNNYGMVTITLCNILVLYCFLRPRFQWWVYPMMIALTYFALPLVYKICTELFTVPIGYNIMMTGLGYWGNIMVLIAFRERFLKMITLIFTLQILNRLFTFLGYLLQIPLNAVFNQSIDVQFSISLVIFIMYALISLACWCFLRKKGLELMQEEPQPYYWVVLAGIAVFAKLIIDFCSNYAFTLNPSSDSKIIMAMIALSIFVLAVLILYSYSNLITMKHLELKTSTDRLIFEKMALHRYYETQLLNQEELRRMKHDINGNLNTIYRLLSEENIDEATRYLSELYKYNESHQNILYCDEPYLNAVITNYTAKFKENNTQFIIDIQIGKLELNPVEMCLVLNNALQNALEASLQLKPDQRYVKLKIKTKLNRFLLRITNRFNGDLIFDSDLPHTTKKDSGHGYGLTSIRNATESVGGFAVCKIEGDMFVLDVLM